MTTFDVEGQHEYSEVFDKLSLLEFIFYRRIVKSNPWLPYIGDCKALDNFLATKEGFGWMVPKFLNALFRGVGQVVFANNPLTGLVILLSLFWTCPFIGLATFVAATTAIFTAVLFRQEPSQINSGLTTYNAVLIGSVTSALWTPMYGQEMGFIIWAFIILGSALSVFVTAAISNMMGSFKQPLPALTFPFNIVTILLFTCLMPPPGLIPPHTNGTLLHQHGDNMTMQGVAMELTQQLPAPQNNSILNRPTREGEDQSINVNPPTVVDDNEIEKIRLRDSKVLHWGSILKGILLSMGQVYGVNNLVGSILMYFAILLYSPTLFMMSFVGATLGSIFGIIFTEAPFDAVYDGIWGFNGILAASSIGGLFFVLTLHSFGTALANVILTGLIQHALAIAFGPLHLPFLTFPFVLSTFMFLSMTATGDNLVRVTKITFPEIHRYEYLENIRINRPDPPRNRDSSDEIAEEKELVLKEVKVIMEDTPADTTDLKDKDTEEKPTNGLAETEN